MSVKAKKAGSVSSEHSPTSNGSFLSSGARNDFVNKEIVKVVATNHASARGGDERGVHIRVKTGMVEINDVTQHYRPDVDVYFYYKATKEEVEKWALASFDKGFFKNVYKEDHGWPFWTPHFDFNLEVEEVLVTDESFWITKDGYIFGRKNMIPKLQTRINHSSFPYDRQILNIELLSNNCLFRRWEKYNDCPKELWLFFSEWHIQGELSSLADVWDLDKVRIKIEKDEKAMSSKALIFLYIHREPEYYTYNISVMLCLIVFLMMWIPNFPYDESRFDFALQLVLTQIAFRFVAQNLIPRTSYLMHLDCYMLVGFALLFSRFILDFCFLIFFSVPEVEPGDDFRCGWKTSWTRDDWQALPDVCMWDLYITSIMAVFWFVGSAFFLVPGFWQRSWEKVEETVDQEKVLDNIFFEREASGGFQMGKPSPKEPLTAWLKKHGKQGGIQKPSDIKECQPFLKQMKKRGIFSRFCRKEGGNARNCKELRGWTDLEPPSRTDVEPPSRTNVDPPSQRSSRRPKKTWA